MRNQIELQRYVVIRMGPEVVIDELHRHDERHHPFPILVDDTIEFGLDAAIDRSFEVTHDVLQDVTVAPAGRTPFESIHQYRDILVGEFLCIAYSRVCHQSAKASIVDLAVREKQ